MRTLEYIATTYAQATAWWVSAKLKFKKFQHVLFKQIAGKYVVVIKVGI
jgi:hypothetical protein